MDGELYRSPALPARLMGRSDWGAPHGLVGNSPFKMDLPNMGRPGIPGGTSKKHDK